MLFNFGSQNIILNFGSLMQVLIFLEMVLLGYYIWGRKDEAKVNRAKLFQKSVLDFMMIILVYGAMQGVLSVQYYSSFGSSQYSLPNIVVSLLILVGYAVYFIFWIRPQINL